VHFVVSRSRVLSGIIEEGYAWSERRIAGRICGGGVTLRAAGMGGQEFGDVVDLPVDYQPAGIGRDVFGDFRESVLGDCHSGCRLPGELHM
jgi:hypothetical protein